MTEQEICRLYRNAENTYAQLQILAELSGMSRTAVIKILADNGEKIPPRAERQLYRRLENLEGQISEREREYREIVQILAAENRTGRDSHGSRVHGYGHAE